MNFLPRLSNGESCGVLTLKGCLIGRVYGRIPYGGTYDYSVMILTTRFSLQYSVFILSARIAEEIVDFPFFFNFQRLDTSW